ncbi:MAG TPA: cellulase family glycosylhydrolase, partial [Herpetosiphonaceae bacterium]
RQRTPPALTLPPQQTVRTLHPGVGVHTRLGGLGDEAAIERTLAQVREMGATYIVDLFPWAYVQPRSPHAFDWHGSDMLIKHARRQGLQVIARLDFVPAWARPANTNDRYLDPAHYDDYARYVAAFAARYAPDGVRMLQIWNEPNLRFEWGDRPPDPQAYAALLKAVYPAVKAAAPDALVTVAGLAPGGPGGPIDPSALSANDLEYLAALLEAGAPFDAVAVHAYGGQSPADQPPDPAVVNFRRTELVRKLLLEQGRDVPIVITEGGWNDHPRWQHAVGPPERVRYTVDAYAWAAQHWPWLEATCLWQFSMPWTAYTYIDNYTFVTPEGTPKAIYYAVQRWAQTGAKPGE